MPRGVPWCRLRGHADVTFRYCCPRCGCTRAILLRPMVQVPLAVACNFRPRGLRRRRFLQLRHLPPPPIDTCCHHPNISVVYLSTNPVQHQRTKHMEIDLNFVRDFVAIGAIWVLHVLTTSQFADIFTKGLPSSTFAEFRSSLNICCG